jgi:hypothetical protein
MAQIEAIIYNGFHGRQLNQTNYYPPGYLLVSGLTAGLTYYVKTLSYNGVQSIANSAVTAGQFTASSTKGLSPFCSLTSVWNLYKGTHYDMPVTSSVASVSLFSILNNSGVTVATAYMRPAYPYSHANLADWSISQASDKSVVVKLQTLNTVASHSVLYSLTETSPFNSYLGETKPESLPIYTVALLNAQGTQLESNDVHWPKNGSNPVVTFSSSLVVTSGNYVVKISNVVAGPTSDVVTLMSQEIQTVLTAPTVTSGSTNMHSWLDNSYWYLTDLQVNLGTRAVTHRHGTIQLRPSDTINFAILFNDGSVGVDPQATDIKLAVRSSNNTSPYHFWSAATVSTVTVSGDVYYAITVTASDEDLLTAQAANLLAGSNADQSLLAEIQWTTTRGTFSSDTFTINVPSEVVREPDV